MEDNDVYIHSYIHIYNIRYIQYNLLSLSLCVSARCIVVTEKHGTKNTSRERDDAVIMWNFDERSSAFDIPPLIKFLYNLYSY